MADLDYQRQAQEFYAKAPIVILGSGASSAFGMSGMSALATHLVQHTDISGLTTIELEAWEEFCCILKSGVDLERALHQVNVSDQLTARIIMETWKLINEEDISIFHASLSGCLKFPLSNLLNHMFQSSRKILNIITTNYDRLAEYACEQEKIYHYTGFTHGYYRQLAKPTELNCARRVNIWKVHGSLDWFQCPLRNTVALTNIFEIPVNYEPQIVTPGRHKYQKTHLEPYRTIINSADEAINSAGSYLCVGYGFNDEHIQPKLVEKCLKQKTPITIITYKISDSTKKLIIENKAQNYLAIERGAEDDQSIVYSSLHSTPVTVNKNIWSLEGYLTLVM